MLCSDGLSDMCSDSEIEKTMNLTCDSNEMINFALHNGGFDNVSVVVVKVNV